MNNLRKFSTEAEYTAATLNYPAVSWVTATDNVYFNKTAPAAFSGLTVYYNITDISQPTVLFNGGGSGSGSGSGSGVLPSAMIIDDTAVEVTNTYQFSTTGEHIVQYSFSNNAIPQHFIEGYACVKKFEIGDAITSIGYYSFDNNTNLTSVTIGSGVTNISDGAFIGCKGLTSITCLATTPPTLGGNDVFAVTNNCPIYVPSDYVDAYKSSTSTGWYEYASRIQAIS